MILPPLSVTAARRSVLLALVVALVVALVTIAMFATSVLAAGTGTHSSAAASSALAAPAAAQSGGQLGTTTQNVTAPFGYGAVKLTWNYVHPDVSVSARFRIVMVDPMDHGTIIDSFDGDVQRVYVAGQTSFTSSFGIHWDVLNLSPSQIEGELCFAALPYETGVPDNVGSFDVTSCRPPRCDGEYATVNLAHGQNPTSGADIIVGTDANDVIHGYGGDDVICGGPGSDVIAGGNGDDVIIGGPGRDRIFGQGGDDRLDGGEDDDILLGQDGDDILHGGDGRDKVYGQSGDDMLEGGTGDDIVNGGGQTDTCSTEDAESFCEVTEDEPTCGSVEAVPEDCSRVQRVLSIRMLPRDPDDATQLDPWTGRDISIADQRAFIDEQEELAVGWLTQATRYHQYSDASAVSALEFEIIEEHNLYRRTPKGLVYNKPGDNDPFRPNYRRILSPGFIGRGICEYVDQMGVDEVWIWTQHDDVIEPTETNMAPARNLPFYDVSNSERSDDLPRCHHTYVVYNYTYNRSGKMILHVHGHQLESMLIRTWDDSNLFKPEYWSYNGDLPPQGLAPIDNPLGFYRCGSIHYTMNAQYAGPEHLGGHENISTLIREVYTDCMDWRPGGGELEEVSCREWYRAMYGNSDCFWDDGLAWYVFWHQSIPGIGNGIVDDRGQMRNLWQTMGDPDAMLEEQGTFMWEIEPSMASPMADQFVDPSQPLFPPYEIIEHEN